MFDDSLFKITAKATAATPPNTTSKTRRLNTLRPIIANQLLMLRKMTDAEILSPRRKPLLVRNT
ncbi:MAG: hypothetical protein ACLS3Y_02290, partial [Collinsella sp.]